MKKITITLFLSLLFANFNLHSQTNGTCAADGPWFSGTGTYVASVVTTGGTSNISSNDGSTAMGYTDQSSNILSAESGTTISITIDGASWGDLGGWIDTNLDGTFATSEAIFTQNGVSSGSQTLSFVVPTASPGNYVLRITADYYGLYNFNAFSYGGCGYANNPQYHPLQGEVEDYTLTILPSSATCPKPTSLSASSYGQTTAQLSWTAGADETGWEIEYGPTGFTNGTGQTVTSSTNQYTFTDVLSPATTYDFYVRAVCSSSESSDWTGPLSLTTICSSSTTSFYNSFDDSSTLESCYFSIDADGQGKQWQKYSGVTGSGTYAVGIEYEGAAHDDFFYTPPFNVTIGTNDGVSFRTQNWDDYGSEVIDVLLYDATDGTLITALSEDLGVTGQVNSSGTFKTMYYDLSAYDGQDVMVVFHSKTTNLFYFFVDNFFVGSSSEMANGWAGYTDSSYSVSENWFAGAVPTGDVTLNLNSDPASNSPTIDSAVSASSLTVDTGVSLTISENGSLQTTGDFTNGGTVTMNSTATAHSSLIVGGSSTGSITYNRYADIDRWYITSSPVSGQDIDTFISNEDLAVSTNNSSLVGLADYNNDGSQYAADPTITTGWWDYHQSGDDGTFTSGKGKIVRLASDATDNLLGFTGTINGSVSVPMTVATTAFNLIGNPYPAAVQVTSQGGGTDALSANSSGLSEVTAWFWNGASNEYDAVNQNPSQAAKITAPGQGFFVSASGSGDFSFTPSMQTTSAGSFNRQTEWSKIDLSMSTDGGQTSDTEIVYFDGATTGWDNGFDSTNWSSESFQIFTSHVDTSTSQNLAIQSLPLGNFNDMVIPVGVNASAGQMITISVDTTNWPEGANIYLEDVDNGSYTLLDGQNAEFTTLLDSNESGIGRFYIHTTSNSLGDEDLTLTDVSIYASSRDNLRILGINSGDANVQMFDLLGKQVLNTSFNGQSVNDVKLPNLNTGIYLVNLVSDEGTVNKKIIIQ